jgi:DNA-binding MarR family transcriptional regulator
MMMMKIEEAIQQKNFKSEYQKAAINIIFTSSWLNLKHSKVFKEHGITPAQFNVLRILRGKHPEPATVNYVIERMLDKSSNASRIVEKLRIKKLVDRVQCAEDRRAVNVLITKKGLDLLSKIDAQEDQLAVGIGKLSESEAKTLNELLNKLREE